LSDARRASACHRAKGRIQEIAIRCVELSVVEGIEKFASELQALGFCKSEIFEQGHIPVVNSWAMEKAARRISDLPDGFRAEERLVEIQSTLSRIGLLQQLAGSKHGLVDRVAVGACARVPDQTVVVVFHDGDGQSCAETGCA